MIRDPDLPDIKREFAAAPASWYLVCTVAELERKPVRFDLPDGQTFVAFRTPHQKATVISGLCSHMGADLSRGCVKNGRIVCPLHAWEYGRDGRCEHIPASADIPEFARQKTYPVEERAGLVFFFNQPQARFPLPFFDGVDPDAMVPARPIDFTEAVPWYLIGGNGFDKQHFANTHDRHLVAEPVVDSPSPFAMRSQLDLAIGGSSHTDRLTRILAGKQSRMTVTSWCGSLIFANAKFRRTTTYGMIAVRPLPNDAVHARVVVFVPRSRNMLTRLLFDPLHAAVRRHFISEFFKSDLGRLAGIRFHRERMIAADKMLVDYLEWLHKVHR